MINGEEGSDVPFAEWQDPASEKDAEQTLAASDALGSAIDWLVVDNYALAATWESRLRRAAKRILVIDDIANRPHDCDVLLDQNLHAGLDRRYDALVPVDCQRFLGPRYALLRPEFAAHRQSRVRDGTIRRILVFFGGSDPDNKTGKALDALASLARGNLCADVVIGTANPHRPALESRCNGLSWVKLHREVENMAALMAESDLAIGAAGATAWERCCLGLPCIVVALAMNQESSAQALAKAGCAIYLEPREAITAKVIASVLQELIADPGRVAAMARSAAELVDGMGTDRVARALDSKPLLLRRARPDDSEQIHRWRNAEETRRYSHNPTLIASATHQRWFEEALHSENRMLLIGERAGEPVGVLRYDCDQSRCTVSVYLVPGQYGRGYGPRLLLAGHHWVRKHYPRVSAIHAEVLPQNRSSMTAFQQAGYQYEAGCFLKRVQ